MISDGQYYAEQAEVDEPTPSTIELWEKVYDAVFVATVRDELTALRTHMEQLEQDRDEQLRRLDNVSALCVQLEQERDNAQQQANAWHDAATSARQFASRLDVEHLEAKVEQLEQERDEFERKLYELESEQS